MRTAVPAGRPKRPAGGGPVGRLLELQPVEFDPVLRPAAGLGGAPGPAYQVTAEEDDVTAKHVADVDRHEVT